MRGSSESLCLPKVLNIHSFNLCESMPDVADNIISRIKKTSDKNTNFSIYLTDFFFLLMFACVLFE